MGTPKYSTKPNEETESTPRVDLWPRFTSKASSCTATWPDTYGGTTSLRGRLPPCGTALAWLRLTFEASSRTATWPRTCGSTTSLRGRLPPCGTALAWFRLTSEVSSCTTTWPCTRGDTTSLQSRLPWHRPDSAPPHLSGGLRYCRVAPHLWSRDFSQASKASQH
jgi:hypothetical protein